MTIKKFNGQGGVVNVTGDQIQLPDGSTIDVAPLQASPEQKYVGKWSPGTNQPEDTPDTTGPYAGIVRYLPIPEAQTER